ncbi:hypothetical protein PG999_004346 [Apiospora kogelbergensis]|uniref:Ankyrin repeat-containing protein n=1 Tax=Apiospora kogelbergensis TaxID=1337665 RepID=A0AAW0QYZ1_9PEZI
MVEHILKEKLVDVNSKNHFGHTAVFSAVMGPRPAKNMIHLLFEYGADINQTITHVNRDLEKSDVLEIDTPTSDGQTTLEWALSPRHGAPDFAALLLCKGAAIPQRRAQEILGLTQEACNTFNMKAIAGVLSENRSLARCFQVLYNHCVSACSEQKDEIANDFVQKSPAFIVELVTKKNRYYMHLENQHLEDWIWGRNGCGWF